MTDPVRDARDSGTDACELDVLVAPRASRSRIVGLHDDRLKIQLAAPPVDGAANAALCELLAGVLQVPRSALEIARGATGKRKTVRVTGVGAALARARLGLAALLLPGLLAAALACTVEVPFAVKVILPEDAGDLDHADNLGLELGPDGYFEAHPVRGTEFSLELEFEPDAVERTLALYLADGTDLLAYGRSAPFVLLNPPEGLAVLLARPGVLSTYPGAVAEPDPDLLAAHAPGLGLVLLGAAGDIALLHEATLDVQLGARLADPPEPDDGAFVADAQGRLWRVGVAGGLRADMYDPGLDVWAAATVVGDDGLPRPGAALTAAPGRERLYIAGGGTSHDLLALSLAPDEDGLVERTVVADLDGPRTGACLLALARGDTDELVVVGGADEAPAVLFPAGGHALGPLVAWTNIQCTVMDPPDAPTVRVLCLGGLRGGQPTADALLLRWPAAAGDAEVDELPALLTAPLADPRLFADDLAVYAQSGGQWWRLDKDDLGVTVSDSPADRVSGGHSIALGTGVTFLVGGRGPDDRAVDRWWYFAPTLPSP